MTRKVHQCRKTRLIREASGQLKMLVCNRTKNHDPIDLHITEDGKTWKE